MSEAIVGNRWLDQIKQNDFVVETMLLLLIEYTPLYDFGKLSKHFLPWALHLLDTAMV